MISETTPSHEAKIYFDNSGDKEAHYSKILSALAIIGEGCSKEIASKANLSYIEVSRRTSELERQNKIKVVDVRTTRFYKRKVSIYSLV